MTPEEHKEAIKEGLQEWLDKKFMGVGKFSIKGLAAMALVALTYIWASANGWIIK